MRICIIFNKNAGTSAMVQNILFHLDAAHRYEIRPTSAERPARLIAREAVEEGFDRIITAGGDGTLSKVINGIAPDFDAVEIALLPVGTGNDFARMFNLHSEDPDGPCKRALSSIIQRVDVIRISSAEKTSYCINVANGGMGGRITADVKPEDKKRWGSMAYWITSISRLVDLTPFEVTLTLDGTDQIEKTLCIAVANGRFIGGGFPIAPRALINDGLIDVTVVPALPAFELMAAGFNHVLGREQRVDRIRNYRVRTVRIKSDPFMPFSIDGEIARQIDSTFEVVPSALRFVAGNEEEKSIAPFKSDTFVN